MERPITGFRLDEHGDWVALLSCGHPQHVRHDPPFVSRPWVLTEQGRSSRLGERLDCLRCDRFDLPPPFTPYSRTPVFTEATVPAALKRDHSTRAGAWAKIEVLEGTLRYIVDALGTVKDIHAGEQGIVVPEVPHHVEPLGPVRFFVEFYAAPFD